jgi:hypothetical protein
MHVRQAPPPPTLMSTTAPCGRSRRAGTRSNRFETMRQFETMRDRGHAIAFESSRIYLIRLNALTQSTQYVVALSIRDDAAMESY